MIKEKSKFEFVSDEWVEQARMILEDLVSEFGKETVLKEEEVIINIKASAINRADLLQRSGNLNRKLR